MGGDGVSKWQVAWVDEDGRNRSVTFRNHLSALAFTQTIRCLAGHVAEIWEVS